MYCYSTTIEILLHDKVIRSFKYEDENDYVDCDDLPEEVSEEMDRIWDEADEDAKEYLTLSIEAECYEYLPATRYEPDYTAYIGYKSSTQTFQEIYQ